MRTPPGFIDRPFCYPYDVVLTASQALQNQPVVMEQDSDFLWRALAGTFTSSAFTLRFRDAEGRYFSSAMCAWNNYQGMGPMPYMIWPEVWFPGGGVLMVDITDTSVATNTIQLAFIGVKRVRAGGIGCGRP